MLKGNTIINVSACLIRKKYLHNIDFSTINLKLNGDWLIYIYILLESDILLCNKVLNKFRTHSNSVRSNINKTGNSLSEWFSILNLFSNQNLFKPSLVKKGLYNPLFSGLKLLHRKQTIYKSISIYVWYCYSIQTIKNFNCDKIYSILFFY